MKLDILIVNNCANHIQQWTYQHIIAHSDVDRITAMEIATNAANALANRMMLDLKEQKVEVAQ